MIFRILAAAFFTAALGLATPAVAESGDWRASAAGGETSSFEKRKAFAQKENRKLTAREARRAKAEAEALADARKSGRRKIDVRQVDNGTRKPAETPEPIASGPGNSGELRSENRQETGLFSGLFGVKPAMLAETRALDAVLEDKQRNRKFKVKADYEPQMVGFSGYERGTIVIDTAARYLYLVESGKAARRYAIAVGREGLLFTGSAKVGDKQEWPRWIPTLDMQKREPKKYGQYKDGMNGGPDNPLGARAIYLYQGKKDTHIRIHGTNQPETIGTASSNGCFRMVNEHVMDLYGRVRVGTNVVVVNGLS